MVTVHFYEKPGCINNTRQRAMLTAAGHTLELHNLLIETWTVEELRLFFGDRPLPDWFNPSAPAIKSGEVIPAQLNEETALALMVRNPLLIRRPLMQVGDRREVGFNLDLVEEWIGLRAIDASGVESNGRSDNPDLETCPRSAAHLQPCSRSTA